MPADGSITVYVVPGLMPKASDEVKRHMILHKYENYKKHDDTCQNLGTFTPNSQ